MNNHSISLCHWHEADRADGAIVCPGDPGVVQRWADFRADVARATLSIGSIDGRYWAVRCRDSYWFAVALFGLWHAGRVPVLPPNFQPGTLQRFAAECDGVIGDAVDPPGVLLRDDDSEPPPYAWQPLDADRAQLVLHTSGSTGEPKRIVKTLRQLQSELQVLEEMWGGHIGDAEILSSVSHQHIYGLLFRVLWPLCAGRPFPRADLRYPEDCLAALRRGGPSVLVSSPALLKRFDADAAPVAGHDLRMLFSSGGPLPAEVAQRCADLLGVWPVEVLGSTETGGIGWRRQLPDAQGRWEKFPPVILSLSGSGTLVVGSPFLGDAGAFVTGDTATLIDEGHFMLHGRADRIVKIEEKRVSLPELETTLSAHELVEAAAMIALTDNARQHIGCVVVPSAAGRAQLQRDGRQALTGLLRDALLRHFDRVVVPRRFRFVDSLPCNAAGKLVHAELLALFDDAVTEPDIVSIEGEGDARQVTLRIPANLLYLRGHFPGEPILPGVVQMHWAIRLAERHLGLSGRLLSMDNIKFKTIIRPLAVVTLQLSLTDGRKLQFEYRSAHGVHSSGRLLFEPAA
jgi:acyl-CoA synthetase (AMP-forming)/AMP-acid ligase II